MEGNRWTLEDILLRHWLTNQLVKIDAPLCQYTRSRIGSTEGHLSTYLHPPLTRPPLPWLFHQSRTLQDLRLGLAHFKGGKRIGHWCNRWLSIGGRYTLVKVSLEGQSVYWMALVVIPTLVLDKLKKLTFNFL